MQRQACKLVGCPWKWGGNKCKLMLIGDCICNRISLGSLMKARRPFAGSFAKAVLGPWPVMRCSRPCRRCFQERLAHGADGLEAVGAGLNTCTCMIMHTLLSTRLEDHFLFGGGRSAWRYKESLVCASTISKHALQSTPQVSNRRILALNGSVLNRRQLPIYILPASNIRT